MKPMGRTVKLMLLLVVAGCVSNSGQFDLSPCAGCDFQPLNVVQSAGRRVAHPWNC